MNTHISHSTRRTLLPALLVGCAVLGCGTAQAAEPSEMPEFDVTWQRIPILGGDTKQIKAVTHNNEITINNVFVNRGHCPNSFNSWNNKPIKIKPIRLSFGKSFQFYVNPSCEILEVTLITDKGDITYPFS